VFELFTALVKVDVRVINDTITLNVYNVYYRPERMLRAWDNANNEQWRHDQVGRRSLPNV